MAEFKINSALSNEIAALKDSGNLVNDGYASVSSDGVSTLKTSVSIISQHESIKSLMDLYKALVLRDVQDLNDMVEEAAKMDTAIASTHKA